MKRRYQVFVSSTYEDLKEERFEVLKALLELDCIPSGMEYFPAASEDQWTYIRELIAECDYYIVIIAGRYGSTDEAGLSYTEKEYDFAVEQGIPTIGFIHRDPFSRPARFTEASEEGREKLRAFTTKVQRKLCRMWSTPGELEGAVSRGITQLIRRQPRPGWVRADAVITDTESEFEKLQLQVRRLFAVVDRLRGVEAEPQPAKSLNVGEIRKPLASDSDANDGSPEANPASEKIDIALLEMMAIASMEEDTIPRSGTQNPNAAPPSTSSTSRAAELGPDDLAFLEELDRAIGRGANPPTETARASTLRVAKELGYPGLCKECGALNEPDCRYCEICGSEM